MKIANVPEQEAGGDKRPNAYMFFFFMALGHDAATTCTPRRSMAAGCDYSFLMRPPEFHKHIRGVWRTVEGSPSGRYSRCPHARSALIFHEQTPEPGLAGLCGRGTHAWFLTALVMAGRPSSALYTLRKLQPAARASTNNTRHNSQAGLLSFQSIATAANALGKRGRDIAARRAWRGGRRALNFLVVHILPASAAVSFLK